MRGLASVAQRSLAVVAMCGLAFSGKSTAARRVAEALGCDLIVLDRINEERGLDGGAGLSVEQWEETSAIAMGRLGAVLTAVRSAVVDDTHSHCFLRDRCRAVAERHGAAFTVLFMDTPLYVIEERRAANRTDPVRPHIADHVFAAHRAGFQFPTADEPAVVTIRNNAELTQWLGRVSMRL